MPKKAIVVADSVVKLKEVSSRPFTGFYSNGYAVQVEQNHHVKEIDFTVTIGGNTAFIGQLTYSGALSLFWRSTKEGLDNLLKAYREFVTRSEKRPIPSQNMRNRWPEVRYYLDGTYIVSHFPLEYISAQNIREEYEKHLAETIRIQYPFSTLDIECDDLGYFLGLHTSCKYPDDIAWLIATTAVQKYEKEDLEAMLTKLLADYLP